VLSNSVYFLRMKLKDGDEKVKKHLDIMEQEVGLAEGIISNILDFARPKQPIMEQVDINAVIEHALSRVPPPSSVELTLNLEPGLPAVAADPGQMAQMFSNIILNAAQAMPDGGRLTISTGSDGEWVRAEVQDNGMGIAEEDLTHIFEPLFTRKDKGIGLGLAIVKSIVEAHHGSIGLKSEVGQGTTITIELPTGGGNE
jgi:signal transduction histidine kinase